MPKAVHRSGRRRARRSARFAGLAGVAVLAVLTAFLGVRLERASAPRLAATSTRPARFHPSLGAAQPGRLAVVAVRPAGGAAGRTGCGPEPARRPPGA